MGGGEEVFTLTLTLSLRERAGVRGQL